MNPEPVRRIAADFVFERPNVALHNHGAGAAIDEAERTRGELADLGISRSEIPRVAWESAKD